MKSPDKIMPIRQAWLLSMVLHEEEFPVRPTWLIEAGVYGDEASLLLAEIRRQGMVAELVPQQALCKGAVPTVGGQGLTPEACVLGYGTFPFARQIQPLLQRD
jgi:hypothetical protein